MNGHENPIRVRGVDYVDGEFVVRIEGGSAGWVVLSIEDAQAVATGLGQVLLDHALSEAGAEPIGPEPMSGHERAEWMGLPEPF